MYDIVMKDLQKQNYYSLNYCLSKAQVLLWSIYNLSDVLVAAIVVVVAVVCSAGISNNCYCCCC